MRSRIAPVLPLPLPLPHELSLPAHPNAFVGREKQIDDVLGTLAERRLVTLVGPGGVGKTRLALRAAELAASEYSCRAYLVELAGVDRADVDHAVRAALPIAAERGRGLSDAEALLVVDNCEHVRAECAVVVHWLLRTFPGMSVLATSRQPLQVAGEHVLLVEPLTLPETDVVDSGGAEAAEAVRVFLERVRAVRPQFQLDAANTPTVVEICSKLDGLPLAIELAAARLAVLSPAEVLARLDDPFRFLTDRSTVAPKRHRSLEAALEWGHALLTEAEALLFARLSVFARAWDLEAAAAVCAGGTIAADDILDLLTSLVSHSLLAVDSRGPETRFRMISTVAQFATRKLTAAGEADVIAEQHARWCVRLAERAAAERGGPNPQRWLDALDENHAEFRVALRWARAHERGDIALALGCALSWFWEMRGHLSEGVDCLRWAVEREADATDAELRARALRGAGILTWLMGDAAAAKPLVDESVGLFREAGNEKEASGCVCSSVHHVCENPVHSLPMVESDLVRMRERGDCGRLARSLVNAGMAHFFVGDGERAKTCFEECLALPRDAVELEVVVDAQLGLGRVNVLAGDLATAETLFRETLELAGSSGDSDGRSATLGWIGEIHRIRGDYTAARASMAEAMKLAGDAYLPLSRARCHQFLGRLEASEGNLQRARSHLKRSIEAPCGTQMSYHRVRSLQALADVAVTDGTTAGVRETLEEAMSLATSTGDRHAHGLLLTTMARLAAVEDDPDAAARLAHEALKIQERINDVFGIVTTLETLAEVTAARGRPGVAARLIGAVQTAREARGCRGTLIDEPERTRRLPQLAALLVSGKWATEVAGGSHLSMQEAVSYAVKGRGSKDRPAIGWDSLTRAERDIANLVAEGLSNHEIGDRLLISARTVETHLSHVYRKVPVANRRELGRSIRERNVAARTIVVGPRVPILSTGPPDASR